MYCPKCGAQSDSGRFCRSCGMNLVMVSTALSDSQQDSNNTPTLRGKMTFGVFRPAKVNNLRRDLKGHNVAAIFGDVVIDLTAEDLPLGETTIHVYSIFSSLNILAQDDVGIRITGVTMFGEIKMRDQQVGNGVFSVSEYRSPGYSQSVRRLHIDATSVFSSVKLKK
ncbi:MAG TPA: LiaF domain-containing protein [Blastocatellia bacterium]|nr:LiaF domain-containing protein [Blastocatellia bacterium]